MSDFRTLTPRFSAAPQITAADVAEAARLGFTAIICNRPDMEEPGQIGVDVIAKACGEHGLSFTHIPVAGGIPDTAISAMVEALAASSGPVLAYCRSGTRSTNLWALAEAYRGAVVDGLITAARQGGYDVSGLAPLLQRLVDQAGAT